MLECAGPNRNEKWFPRLNFVLLMKTFQIPAGYRSPLITAVKQKRRTEDKMKKDFSPTLLDFGPLRIYLARHFGFCYGVENAIDIAFRTVLENPGKNIFLLSEMIHNPQVNEDLQNQGIRFLQRTNGEQLISFDTLQKGDIVITPAFGTSLEVDAVLKSREIHTEQYNTTCPFVEKVWNRAGQIAEKNFTVIIHGKPCHEETRATFSRAASGGPALVIRDMEEARQLAGFIRHEQDAGAFFHIFRDRYSQGFDPARHLERIGVVNQTTMLASETQGIADFLKQAIQDHHDKGNQPNETVFADTRDTLCYATNDNQSAVPPAPNACGSGHRGRWIQFFQYFSSRGIMRTRLPTYFVQVRIKKYCHAKQILSF